MKSIYNLFASWKADFSQMAPNFQCRLDRNCWALPFLLGFGLMDFGRVWGIAGQFLCWRFFFVWPIKRYDSVPKFLRGVG